MSFIPKIISWILTYRCNRNCIYCGSPSNQGELSTKELIICAKKLKDFGVRRIYFTGGEPLIREDFVEIVNVCSKMGFLVYLNTNGDYIGRVIGDIKDVKKVTLSLDGPEEINDSIRGENSYKNTIEAVEILKRRNFEVSFYTVLSELNSFPFVIDHILNIVKFFKATVFFQPAKRYLLRNPNVKNPIFPSKEKYKNIINYIFDRKRRNYLYIANSFSGLKHLGYFPEGKVINCAGTRLFYRLENNADLIICSQNRTVFGNLLKDDIRKFPSGKNIKCSNCTFAAKVEANLIFQGNLESSINYVLISFFRKYFNR